ncbi:hypothetical protein SLEP1_g31426 [Rubroshorea leprosula]|uniref:Uncharacterized protein n=1 Tax=Rubroshorea leprosula TaxID=152421 RepID=A0AAV5KAS6_9ROSI|nr:hypothetical protein SLEP1_g31426 [Rubroshorea leprosula]
MVMLQTFQEQCSYDILGKMNVQNIINFTVPGSGSGYIVQLICGSTQGSQLCVNLYGGLLCR